MLQCVHSHKFALLTQKISQNRHFLRSYFGIRYPVRISGRIFLTIRSPPDSGYGLSGRCWAASMASFGEHFQTFYILISEEVYFIIIQFIFANAWLLACYPFLRCQLAMSVVCNKQSLFDSAVSTACDTHQFARQC